jgi:hypothetical protein
MFLNEREDEPVDDNLVAQHMRLGGSQLLHEIPSPL